MEKILNYSLCSELIYHLLEKFKFYARVHVHAACLIQGRFLLVEGEIFYQKQINRGFN